MGPEADSQQALCLKGGYHDNADENRYVVTARHSREIRDVTNGVSLTL